MHFSPLPLSLCLFPLRGETPGVRRGGVMCHSLTGVHRCVRMASSLVRGVGCIAHVLRVACFAPSSPLLTSLLLLSSLSGLRQKCMHDWSFHRPSRLLLNKAVLRGQESGQSVSPCARPSRKPSKNIKFQEMASKLLKPQGKN